jgi:hypothetical protein
VVWEGEAARPTPIPILGDQPKAQAFESYLAAHPGAIDLWLGGHTHTHPDDALNGRSHVERKWGVNFVNCAQLSNSTAM